MLSALGRFGFVLMVPLLLVSGSLAYAVNEERLYAWGFRQYDVAHQVQLTEVELRLVARGMIGYFNGGEGWEWNLVPRDGGMADLFNQREKQHLADVKGLIWLDYRVLGFSIAMWLTYGWVGVWRKGRAFGRRLAEDMLCGSIVTLVLLGGVGLLLVFAFEQLFWQFHLLSFANDLWQLDPARDRLIRMFPPDFFLGAAAIVAGLVALKAAILGGVSFAYLHREQRNQAKAFLRPTPGPEMGSK